MSSSVQQQASEKTDSAKQQAQRAVNGAKEQAQDGLNRVAAYSKQLRPAQDYVEQQLQHRPILTIYTLIFVGLSFVPVVSFGIWALASVLVVGGTALLISGVILGVVLGGAAFLLFGALFLSAIGAIIGTLWVGGIYALYRLLVCVSNAPTLQDGVKSFVNEVTNLFVGQRGGVDMSTQGDVKELSFKVET
ncbi:hypothetical protein OIO90_001163 [Microbotryomycetes sp. JL221]|nr:hypothetical protein OIO90_001163 [Microbotryomycetes sp. JL221]